MVACDDREEVNPDGSLRFRGPLRPVKGPWAQVPEEDDMVEPAAADQVAQSSAPPSPISIHTGNSPVFQFALNSHLGGNMAISRSPASEQPASETLGLAVVADTAPSFHGHGELSNLEVVAAEIAGRVWGFAAWAACGTTSYLKGRLVAFHDASRAWACEFGAALWIIITTILVVMFLLLGFGYLVVKYVVPLEERDFEGGGPEEL